MKKNFPYLLCVIVTILVCIFVTIVICALCLTACALNESTDSSLNHNHFWSRPEDYDDEKHCQICLECNKTIYYTHKYTNGICICGKQEPCLEYALLQNLSCSVIGKGTLKDNKIVIPAVYRGLPVTTIGDYAFNDCNELTSVTINNGITLIGKNSFKGCSSLASISLPNSVTSIGEYAFYGCTSLTSITISKNIKFIDEWAFGHCNLLNEINYTGTISDWDAVEKSVGWDYDILYYTVRCKDGDIVTMH